MQNKEIENIRKLYLGPAEDVDALREAMDNLIEVQTRAVVYADQHSEDEVQEYMDAEVYPLRYGFHPHGIKIMLEDGQVGRVQEIISKA